MFFNNDKRLLRALITLTRKLAINHKINNEIDTSFNNDGKTK